MDGYECSPSLHTYLLHTTLRVKLCAWRSARNLPVARPTNPTRAAPDATAEAGPLSRAVERALGPV